MNRREFVKYGAELIGAVLIGSAFGAIGGCSDNRKPRHEMRGEKEPP